MKGLTLGPGETVIVVGLPRVTCIMIFLDAERFITEAIESVLGQTFAGWELLLVDDGSRDASTATARYYASQHPTTIRYLEHEEHENRGMSAARNLGIRHARGEYVAFLDADDVWLPTKLEQQVAILDSQPAAAMVYGRTLIWCSWTGEPADLNRDHTLDLGVPPNTLVRPPTLFVLLLQNQVQTPTTCNAILRRRVFDSIGGFEESFPGMYEDQVFFAKVTLGEPVFVSDTCWAKYRQHPESHSARAAGDYHTIRLPFLNWLEHYLRSAGVPRNAPPWRALQRELWPCRHPAWHRLLTLPQRLRRRLARRRERGGVARAALPQVR